jgi:diacylglycerol O-acyltransferase
MERLSSLDASFLYLERARTPMHISSLAIYEGPPPAEEEMIEMLDRRMPLVPRFRDRLAKIPFGAHRPVWINDVNFDISAHVRRVRLFGRGGESELMELVGSLLSQPLSRSRPLWEMWLIEGLSEGRFAVLSKTHHSLWDGVSGVDLHAILLDASPDAKPDEPFTWDEMEREPSAPELLAHAISDRTKEAFDLARGVVNAARDPRRAINEATSLVRGTAEFARSIIRPAPKSRLNRTTSTRRRYSLARGSLADDKALRRSLDVSVNDAILASVAGGLRDWFDHRGVHPHDVRVMVPVSVRSDDDSTLGNRVAMVVVPLPVTKADPLHRLELISASMNEAKTSGQIEAVDAIARMSAVLPTAGIAAVTQLQSRFRAFNLVVTNIPGPQFPLYLLGRKLLELFPQAPLAPNQGLSVGALSYDGTLGFGLLADHELVPDVDVLSSGIERSLREITSVATRGAASARKTARELSLVSN